jgi:hypothetical protein
LFAGISTKLIKKPMIICDEQNASVGKSGMAGSRSHLRLLFGSGGDRYTSHYSAVSRIRSKTGATCEDQRNGAAFSGPSVWGKQRLKRGFKFARKNAAILSDMDTAFVGSTCSVDLQQHRSRIIPERRNRYWV